MERGVVVDGYPFKRYRWSDGEWGYREPPYSTLKRYLVAKYKVCYFCDIPVKQYPQIDGQQNQPDRATIEHLKPRTHFNHKGRRRHEVTEKVLACYKCNEERNKLFQKGKLTIPCPD